MLQWVYSAFRQPKILNEDVFFPSNMQAESTQFVHQGGHHAQSIAAASVHVQTPPYNNQAFSIPSGLRSPFAMINRPDCINSGMPSDRCSLLLDNNELDTAADSYMQGSASVDTCDYYVSDVADDLQARARSRGWVCLCGPRVQLGQLRQFVGQLLEYFTNHDAMGHLHDHVTA